MDEMMKEVLSVVEFGVEAFKFSMSRRLMDFSS